MKLALLQIDPVVGDLEGNAAKIAAGVRQAGRQGADLAVTPELALLGYLPRDLLLDPSFIRRGWQALADLARDLSGQPPALVGLAEENRADVGRPLFNSDVLLKDGRIGPCFRKTLLPTYDVFDEDRYFEPVHQPQILELNNWRLGVTICEDVWNDRDYWQRQRYHDDPIMSLAAQGVRAVLNLSASPFSVGKQARREEMLAKMAAKYDLPLAYVNQVGGNDDLIFDGRSSVFDGSGQLIARGRGFEEDLILVDLESLKGQVPEDDFSPESEIWRALVLGLRDYAVKCGFKEALL
ncbi:MAG: NAD+ synthase, partial [Deltaproteobacteria bacterium]|nr:NAD+ synthase [Deltaproteobacteria bacterium]